MGHRSVAEAQKCIDAAEFAEWMAFHSIYPIGAERGDWQAALIAMTFANAFRGKHQALFKVRDFLLHWDRGQRKSQEEIEAQLMSFFRAHEEKK